MPLLRLSEHRQQTTDLLHRLCVQITHNGSLLLRVRLTGLLNEIDLPFPAYQAITDLTFTHETLQVDLPAVCAERVAQFAGLPETTDVVLNLIVESWEASSEGFKIRVISEMRSLVEAKEFVYTAEHYTFLLRLISAVYHMTIEPLPDREDIQLHYSQGLDSPFSHPGVGGILVHTTPS